MISIDQLEAVAPMNAGKSTHPRGTLKVSPRLPSAARELVGPLLNSLLADEFALHAATLDYHWNVTGLEFYTLHQLLDEQYQWLGERLGEIAEHARAAGVEVRGSWSELTRSARISAAPGAQLDPDEMVAALASLHEGLGAQLGADATACASFPPGDGTADFFAHLRDGHLQAAESLRRLLEPARSELGSIPLLTW